MELIFVALLGIALGSFVNALVWRTYMRERNDAKMSKKTKAALSIAKGRSVCPDCRHQLAARDLIPIVSWMWLRGKCRYCKKSISIAYPVIEGITGFLLVMSYVFWPHLLGSVAGWALFLVWAVVLCVGMALALYDLKWMILPNKLVYVFNGVSAAYLLLYTLQKGALGLFANGVIGAVLFSGFFYILFQISKGKWIGGGDVRIAIGLGLLLGWQKSILALMVAAYLGTFVILLLLIIKKYHRQMKLPFGPFLLAGTYFSVLFGQHIIDWYLRISGL